ncbi:MAG TPA: GIY-YIG nuclease family protein [Pyrinomonadaceae bacterium]|nr:GIY-YIG nuclease family protein [Pyrinomonadaceae bacterium]
MSIYIYALIDPRDGKIRYVGKAKDLKRRIWNHTVPSKLSGTCHRQNWLRQLRSEKLKPAVQILETLPENSDWTQVERKWIRELRAKGFDLVNTTEGGEGGATMTGRKRIISAETRARISASRKGICPKWSASTLKARAQGIRNAWARRREEG